MRILQVSNETPDPYMSKNYEFYLDYENHHLWFECEFDLDSDFADQLIRIQQHSINEMVNLIFEGIDTFGEIFLNGQNLGCTNNMHLRWRFPVSDKLQASENFLVVQISPLPPDNQSLDPSLAISTNGWKIRKPQHMFGWDILPRILSGGIFRPAYLAIERLPTIESAWIELLDMNPDLASMRVGLQIHHYDEDNLNQNTFGIKLKVQAPTNDEIITRYRTFHRH